MMAGSEGVLVDLEGLPIYPKFNAKNTCKAATIHGVTNPAP